MSERARAALVLLALACAVGRLDAQLHADEPTCAVGAAREGAWIDVPTFWINVDSAVERSERMRAQLRDALLPGTCATRVPAVTVAQLGQTVRGGLLLSEDGSGNLRFESPSTKRVEIAVMLSHLKALLFASRLGVGLTDAFLILEDDVDLGFTAAARASRPEWPTARLSADGLRRSLPDDWAFAQLMLITLPKRWRLMCAAPRCAAPLAHGARAAPRRAAPRLPASSSHLLPPISLPPPPSPPPSRNTCTQVRAVAGERQFDSRARGKPD